MTTLEPEHVAIRGYELRLVRCTLTPSHPSDPRHQRDPLDALLNSIERGNYIEALTSEYSSELVFRLGAHHESLPLHAADTLYSELVHRAESFVRDAAADAAEQRRRAIIVMCIAVAAFLGFTQSNFTG